MALTIGRYGRLSRGRMPKDSMGLDITRSALIIVDMQNDFLHPDGSFAHIAEQHPEAMIDLPVPRRHGPHCAATGRCLPSRRKAGCLRRTRA